MNIWRKALDLINSLGWEVLVGIIVAGVLAVMSYLWRRVPPMPDHKHRVLVYVSSGGTCRDPMAKAITQQLLTGRTLRHPVDVYAVGLAPSDTGPSFAAQKTIEDMYHRDLLKDHKPSPITADLINKADIILVMDKGLYDTTEFTLPREKTYILKEFFGLKGDIADPYRLRGERDPSTLARYKACADELEKILSENMDALLKALGAL